MTDKMIIDPFKNKLGRCTQIDFLRTSFIVLVYTISTALKGNIKNKEICECFRSSLRIFPHRICFYSVSHSVSRITQTQLVRVKTVLI